MGNQLFSKQNREAGLSLIEMIVSVAVFGILAAGMTSLSTVSLKQQGQSNLTFQADSIRRNLRTTINNPNAWLKTVVAPENSRTQTQSPNRSYLDCLKPPGTPCTDNGLDLAKGGRPIQDAPINVILNPKGDVYYKPMSASQGFSPRGADCTTFSPDDKTADPNCPLRFEVTWSAICTSKTCVNPQVEIKMKALYNPGLTSRLNFNPANYSSKFLWGSGDGQACWTLVGSAVIEDCGNVGIGTATPYGRFNVVTDSPADHDADDLFFDTYNDIGSASKLIGRRARGTLASPNPVQAGDFLAGFFARGHNGAGFSDNVGGLIVSAEDDFSISTRTSIELMTSAGSGFAERLRVNPDGQVGIGISNPAYLLDVAGDVNSATNMRVAGVVVCRSSGCASSSDARLKRNVRPLPSSLQKILSLQGVSYDWIDQVKFGKGQQIGFIAQDLEKVFPQVVLTDEKTGLKSVAYDHLVAPVIEAVKSLNLSLEKQKSVTDSQAAQISSLQRENAELRAYLCAKDPTAPICKPAKMPLQASTGGKL